MTVGADEVKHSHRWQMKWARGLFGDEDIMDLLAAVRASADTEIMTTYGTNIVSQTAVGCCTKFGFVLGSATGCGSKTIC